LTYNEWATKLEFYNLVALPGKRGLLVEAHEHEKSEAEIPVGALPVGCALQTGYQTIREYMLITMVSFVGKIVQLEMG